MKNKLLILTILGLAGSALLVISSGALPAKGEVFSFGTGTGGNPQDGARTWANRCGGCHNIREATEFRDDQWQVTISHMKVRAGLSGQQARDVLVFLQQSNNPVPATRVRLNDNVGQLSGQDIYDGTCIACHGADGKGAIPGTPDFTKSDSPLSKSDSVLLGNIMNGFQTPGSPMAMPPMGGNSDLGAGDIQNVLTYLRETFGS